MLLFFVACALAFFIACETVQKPADPTLPTPQPVKESLAWAGKHKDADLWTEKLKQAIVASNLPESVPTDIKTFCPGYEKLDKQGKLVVWMQLMSIMTKYESSFNPKTYYMEPPPLGYSSIGLFQLSYEDQANYPDCQLIRKEKNLEDGVTNIKCAVIILSKLVSRDNRVAGYVGGWKGGARYWSVLRSDNKGKPRPAYSGIVAYMKSVKECKAD